LVWTIELHPEAVKQLERLAKRDRPAARRITKALDELRNVADPRSRGKALSGPLSGLWRYRVGDWRIVADVQNQRCVILALDIEHRSRAYR
jgi:mRNA interferase RelE/StbE